MGEHDGLATPPPYAGGSYGRTHVDVGMLRYFHDCGCRSMLDVGCGPGGQVQAANALGYRALGIDVDPALYLRPGVALIDICDGPVRLPARADLVWSVEVAEHVPESCVPEFIATLTGNARIAICLTASQEPMPQHRTLHPPTWWIAAIEAMGGWSYDPDTPAIVARHSTMAREFLRDTGMIFWRRQ